jgi:hypothetical protein
MLSIESLFLLCWEICSFKCLICKSVSLFSLNFYNFGYSAYSDNRHFLCRFIILNLFISANYMFVKCTQFVYVTYCSAGDLYVIKLDLFCIWWLYCQIWISGTTKKVQCFCIILLNVWYFDLQCPQQNLGFCIL